MTKLVGCLGVGLFLVACDVHINAIDVKKSGSAISTLTGGCDNKAVEGVGDAEHPELFDIQIVSTDMTSQIKGAPGDACIESVGTAELTLTVDSLTPRTDQCDANGGTLTFNTMHLETDSGKPAGIDLTCGQSADLASAADVQAVANACAAQHIDTIKEWMRQAFNSKAKTIRMNGTIDCSAEACFSMKTTVKARLKDVTVHVMKGCTEKK